MDWSERFRAGTDQSVAQCVLESGATALAPSHIPSVAKQAEMISAAGLYVREMRAFDATQLLGPLSPKLLVEGKPSRVPVVRGFTVEKQ